MQTWARSSLWSGHLFEEASMKDSMKNHDVSRWFISEPDSTEGAPLVCRTCWSDLILHQPDPEMPERILGTCDECKTWYLSWRPPVGAPVPRSSGLANRFR